MVTGLTEIKFTSSYPQPVTFKFGSKENNCWILFQTWTEPEVGRCKKTNRLLHLSVLKVVLDRSIFFSLSQPDEQKHLGQFKQVLGGNPSRCGSVASVMTRAATVPFIFLYAMADQKLVFQQALSTKACWKTKQTSICTVNNTSDFSWFLRNHTKFIGADLLYPGRCREGKLHL